jgi:hypothetical protein
MALARNKKAKRETPTPGFAIAIMPATDLGLAMLIAETEDGHYEPDARRKFTPRGIRNWSWLESAVRKRQRLSRPSQIFLKS